MPQTVSIKKQHLKAGASYVKKVHCINRLVICQKIKSPVERPGILFSVVGVRDLNLVQKERSSAVLLPAPEMSNWHKVPVAYLWQ